MISMHTVGWFCYYQYFPLNSFCSTLVNDHREYFIWLLLPYFSDDKTIYFFFSEALASSCPQFSEETEIWFCKHSPEWRNVWKTWGFFFVYLSFFVQTRDLFFVFPIIYVITLEWSDRQLDNCKQIYAIYMNFHLFFFCIFLKLFMILLNVS